MSQSFIRKVPQPRSHRRLKGVYQGLFIATAISGGFCSGAFAADPPAPPVDAGAVEELVVTAKRSADKTQDVPAPIIAINGDALEAAHVDNVVDLPKLLPSADFHAYNANNAVVTARGLGAESVGAGQLGDVGIYVDGVYLARQNEVLYGLHDLDNVHLDLGPQGTASGRANIAGALYFESAKPTFTPGGSASVSLGTYNTEKYAAVLNGPLVDNIDAVRLSVYSNYNDGAVKNFVTGGKVNESEDRGVRFQNLYQRENFSLRLMAIDDAIDQHAGLNTFSSETIQKAGSSNFQQKATAAGANLTIPHYILPTDNKTTDINHWQNFKGYDNRLSGQADWEISDHLTLTSISAVQAYKIWPNNDGDHSALDINTNSGSHNWSTQRTQEFRLESKDNKTLDWLVGSFYSFDRDTQISDTGFGKDAFAFYTRPTTVAPANWTSANVNGVKYTASAFTQSETEALFGQTKLHLDPAWTLVTGLRESWDRRTVSGDSHVVSSGGGNFTNDQIATFGSTAFGSFNGAASSANLGAKAALNYQADDDVLLYTSLGRAYKPGGTQTGILSSTAIKDGGSTIFQQERAIDGELGAKTQWLDKKLTINGNLYRGTDFGYQENVGVLDAGGSVQKFLANVKAVQFKGAELEASYNVTPQLKIGTLSSYNLTTYQSYRNAPCPAELVALQGAHQHACDMSGQRVFGSSRWTTNLSAEYTEPLADDVDGYVNASYSHKSGLWLDATNTNQSWQKAYGTVNASVGTRLRGGDIDLSLWASNIFDTRFITYFTSANGANWVTLNDPVTIGATAKIKF